MPRFPRSYIKTSYFHVITQGINKSYIFDRAEDIKYYIKIMYILAEEQEVKILAYCVMNNHAHILIETEEVKELSKYMQRLNTKYGIYYNKKYDRVGYVFRNRYKSEGIYGKKHLYNCIRYIYDNPVKAGICSKAEQYPYSNYKRIPITSKEDYIFLDIDDRQEICENIIENFLTENNIKLVNLKKDRKKLKELIRILKEKYNISLRKIAEKLEVSRETIRRIYNK